MYYLSFCARREALSCSCISASVIIFPVPCRTPDTEEGDVNPPHGPDNICCCPCCCACCACCCLNNSPCLLCSCCSFWISAKDFAAGAAAVAGVGAGAAVVVFVGVALHGCFCLSSSCCCGFCFLGSLFCFFCSFSFAFCCAARVEASGAAVPHDFALSPLIKLESVAELTSGC